MLIFFIPAEQTLKVFDPLIDQKVQKILFDVTFIRTQTAFFFNVVLEDGVTLIGAKASSFLGFFTEIFT
jgi:hypothetical protein